jgi:hypothetical protein
MMTEEKGGLATRDSLLVQQLPHDEQAPSTVSVYDEKTIARIPEDEPANGYTFLVIPAFSDVHLAYGKDAPTFKNIFSHPIVGWSPASTWMIWARRSRRSSMGEPGRPTPTRRLASMCRFLRERRRWWTL